MLKTRSQCTQLVQNITSNSDKTWSWASTPQMLGHLSTFSKQLETEITGKKFNQDFMLLDQPDIKARYGDKGSMDLDGHLARFIELNKAHTDLEKHIDKLMNVHKVMLPAEESPKK